MNILQTFAKTRAAVADRQLLGLQGIRQRSGPPRPCHSIHIVAISSARIWISSTSRNIPPVQIHTNTSEVPLSRLQVCILLQFYTTSSLAILSKCRALSYGTYLKLLINATLTKLTLTSFIHYLNLTQRYRVLITITLIK